MNAIRLRLRVFLVVLLVVVITGSIGFAFVEGIALGDAVYFTIVTVATVGYGDIHPTTAAGKALAVVIIVTGVGAFVGVIGNAVEMTLARREHASRMVKLNMVIGAFYSEVGTALLGILARASAAPARIRSELRVTPEWGDKEFERARATTQGLDCSIQIDGIDLDGLASLLASKREFLVRLLENPVLLEYERFTDLLWAVFHLAEELGYRGDTSRLPASDRAHLAGDATRAYGLLVLQWLDYVKHLKARYPYLFSLVVRTNPFDEHASAVVH